MNRGIQVILVTSGAIGVGVPIIGFQEKPSYLPYKQAAAAVGQGFLMNVYERFFHEYGHHVGQVLLTKGDSLNPKRYMYARGMMMALLELGVLPIINEMMRWRLMKSKSGIMTPCLLRWQALPMRICSLFFLMWTACMIRIRPDIPMRN